MNTHTHGFDAPQMHQTTPHRTTHVASPRRCNTFPASIMPSFVFACVLTGIMGLVVLTQIIKYPLRIQLLSPGKTEEQL